MDSTCNGLDEGGLTRAVLTDQCVYLTFFEGNGYVVKSGNAGVDLGYIFQFQFRGKRLLSA